MPIGKKAFDFFKKKGFFPSDAVTIINYLTMFPLNR